MSVAIHCTVQNAPLRPFIGRRRLTNWRVEGGALKGLGAGRGCQAGAVPAREARLGVRQPAAAFQTGHREDPILMNELVVTHPPARGQARAKKGGSKLPHSKALRAVQAGADALSPHSPACALLCGPLRPLRLRVGNDPPFLRATVWIRRGCSPPP